MKFFNRAQSEDLPHESGIKTHQLGDIVVILKSKDLPHVSGIKTRFPAACSRSL